MHVYLMAQSLRHQFKPGDEIIVTEQDHEANVGAWRQLAEFGLVIREWPVDRATGALRYEELDKLLSPRTKLVAFTHCSNVASIVHDVPALAQKIHAVGALAFVDGTAYAPHFPVESRRWIATSTSSASTRCAARTSRCSMASASSCSRRATSITISFLTTTSPTSSCRAARP